MSPRHEFVRVPRRTYYPVVAPASVETLRLNRYDKWTDNDQTVISDRACVLGTWRWGLAHGGLPTPQVSQDLVALSIPPKLYPLLVILTTLANQWRILKSHLRVGRGQGGGERLRGRRSSAIMSCCCARTWCMRTGTRMGRSRTRIRMFIRMRSTSIRGRLEKPRF